MNEPVAPDPEGWNRAYRPAFDALREREPQRTIVLGSNSYQSPRTFPDLAVPDDPHLLLSFHFSHPMLITHYRAGFTLTKHYAGEVHSPGRPVAERDLDAMDPADRQVLDAWHDWNRPYDRHEMIRDITPALDVARAHGRPLYCGEFGVIENLPLRLQQAWLRDIVSVFDEFDIAYANWDYKGGFGILTRDGEDKGILPLLLGKAAPR